ncbi:MAG: UDP-N-acetylmuramoyl-L-alanyl-D-glutamate--2,6-diaminopimelate ligase [Acidimicrobiales bacterium]|nr:UDP-N-acetylmuramoyl-L-alanyl-D-glutamate--2,6-diaminopimelate ligase [Acidimicrobiales bacterium]
MPGRPRPLRQAEAVRLDELMSALAGLPGIGAPTVLGVASDELSSVEIGRATHDSRQVRPGDLFCCVSGSNADGHDFAQGAVAAGAAALLVERSLELGVPELLVSDVRAAMGPVASVLAGDPSSTLEIVGITGTNGKTTTTQFLAAILNAAGRNSGMIGTLSGVRTTPEAPELQQLLGAFLTEGRRAVVMEVSSHALEMRRVDGIRFRVAVFTNLSRDHLDFHGDMNAYFQAKARLFEPERADLAVLNVDDPHGRLLLDAAVIPSVGYGIADAEDLEVTATGSSFTWRGARISLNLPGRFNVVNAIAAATAAAEMGVSVDHVAAGLATVETVPGRFERVEEGQPFLAAVDFAHTPDGMEHLLAAAREIAGSGRVIVVFGAGGDRDRTKRPEMGAVAARIADSVFLTTDNPRHEDPAAIMDDVERGMEEQVRLVVEPDRRRAIELAAAEAAPGDVLVVAGKGHERHQIVGDDVLPFDDREVLATVLRARAGGSR